MSKIDATVREACRIRALVYHSIADYSQPNDGFCDLCPNSHDPESFRDSGTVAQYIRTAVVEKLKRDGYAIDENFDPETGVDSTASRTGDEMVAARRRRMRQLVESGE